MVSGHVPGNRAVILVLAFILLAPTVFAHAGEVHTEDAPAVDRDAASGSIFSSLIVPVVAAALLLAVAILYRGVSGDRAVMGLILLLILTGFVVMFTDALYFVNLQEKPSMALEKMESIPEDAARPLSAGRLVGLGLTAVVALLLGSGVAAVMGRAGIIPEPHPAEAEETGREAGQEQEKVVDESAETETGPGGEGTEGEDDWWDGGDESEVGNW